jgi:hypothetical protein
MAFSETVKSKEQIDDYLDLYNFARQAGDTLWQADIVAQLKEAEQTDSSEKQTSVSELWETFDAVNAKLLRLYLRLHKTTDKKEVESLWEEVWELKDKRIEIMRELYSEVRCK